MDFETVPDTIGKLINSKASDSTNLSPGHLVATKTHPDLDELAVEMVDSESNAVETDVLYFTKVQDYSLAAQPEINTTLEVKELNKMTSNLSLISLSKAAADHVLNNSGKEMDNHTDVPTPMGQELHNSKLETVYN